MDPSIIARARRKCIYARMVDGDPIGDAKLLSDPFVQAGQCKVSHTRSSLLSVRQRPPLLVAVLLRPLIFVAFTILNLRIASPSALPPRNIPTFDTSAKPRVRLEFCEGLKRSPTGVDWAGCDTARSTSGQKATMLLCNQSDAGNSPRLGSLRNPSILSRVATRRLGLSRDGSSRLAVPKQEGAAQPVSDRTPRDGARDGTSTVW
jgi:hypothetical protein